MSFSRRCSIGEMTNGSISIIFLPLTMSKGVVSRGAAPRRHGEHEVGSAAQVGHSAVLRIVNDLSNEVGPVLRAEGVGLVHESIGRAPKGAEGWTVPGAVVVDGLLGVDQIDHSVDTGCIVGLVGFLESQVLSHVVKK